MTHCTSTTVAMLEFAKGSREEWAVNMGENFAWPIDKNRVYAPPSAHGSSTVVTLPVHCTFGDGCSDLALDRNQFVISESL